MGYATKCADGALYPNRDRPTCHRYSQASVVNGIAKTSRLMPWKDDIRLYIEENPGRAWLRNPDIPCEHVLSEVQLPELPADAKLSLWVVLKNHYYALLAASGELKRFYPQLRNQDGRFVQLVIAARPMQDGTPARPVAWPFGKSDYREKTIRKTTIKQFAGSLTAPGNFRGERCLWGSNIVVEHVDDEWNEKIQNWAIDEFLKYTWKNNFLDIAPDAALDLVRAVY